LWKPTQTRQRRSSKNYKRRSQRPRKEAVHTQTVYCRGVACHPIWGLNHCCFPGWVVGWGSGFLGGHGGVEKRPELLGA